ncbi:large ribosomal subunit protein uL24m-like [Clavelina lepadiformis]|uniref:Large ribosomal subunit protein uL24m n=1 Tax=Clavelina lepadiformis TaxID=159417 RepID=A0ABP0GJU7_CLALP
MRLTRFLLEKRGWLRLPGKPPESFRLIRHGALKWRDYRPREIDPPYWYKWTLTSPYSAEEQQKIMTGQTIAWYQHNYNKMKIVPPDKWLYEVGDKVQILVGKDEGKQGEVIQVVREGNLIVVGGLNCKRQTSEGGMMSDVEQPLQHHEVSLIDPKTSKPVSVEFKVSPEGKRVRVSKESGHIIHWPPEKLADGTLKSEFKCGEKDTTYEDACKRTFVPTMETWEEELQKISGINDPPRRKTFWY